MNAFFNSRTSTSDVQGTRLVLTRGQVIHATTVLLFILASLLNPASADSMSAPETEVRSSQLSTDACNFNGPPIYCNCDPAPSGPDSDDVWSVKCAAWGSPEPEFNTWTALGGLRNLTFMEFYNRPERALKYFPPQQLFGDLKKLHYFNMRLSQVEEIPENAFTNSSSLAEISMVDNKISRIIPESFSRLSNLTKIDLGLNDITEINRKVFVDLPKLQYLFLDRNHIELIHDFAFKDLNNLLELDLHKNNLTVLTPDVFSGLVNMLRLDLQSNLIEFLGDRVFAEMPLLQELDLHGNQIRSVSPAAFAGLKHLGRLTLKDNKIVTLQPHTFDHLRMIFMLDVRENELETLSEGLIQPVYPNLKNVSMQLMLEGNRLMCDCRILWMPKLYLETESDHVKSNLAKIQCNLFTTAEQKRRELTEQNQAVRVSYSSNVTVVNAPPEETTTYAFDSIKNVIELDAEDFKCHHKHHQVNLQESHSDAAYPASLDDSKVLTTGEDRRGNKDQNSFVGKDKNDSQRGHHQSHIDISQQSLGGGGKTASNSASSSSSSLLFLHPHKIIYTSLILCTLLPFLKLFP